MNIRVKKINFNIVLGLILIIFAILCFLPFYYVVLASLSDPKLIKEGELLLFPKGFSLESYQMILINNRFLSCLKVTVVRTMLGTILNLILQSSFAYALSRKYLPGRKFFMLYIVFTMLFNGGIIPTYLVVKGTHLLDTIWALIIPGVINTWNVIVLRSFFENIPDSLEESAKMDGANDIYIFFKIVIPLSMPAIATIGMFCAVGHWNAFMDAVIYLNSYKLQVLQIYLRDMVVQMQQMSLLGDQMDLANVNSLSIRTAAIMVATLPIILVYPFIQKHFVKGIMIGAVKG